MAEIAKVIRVLTFRYVGLLFEAWRIFGCKVRFWRIWLAWLYFAPVASRVSARRASYFLFALLKESKQRTVFLRCLVGWLCFSPVASRVSARQPSYFFLRRQKKVTKKKASHVRAASRCLALLAAFGTLANSLRSDNASVLIRTLLRCSARPNGGGIPHGSSASRTSPEWLVRCAHLAGLGLPHSSSLTSLKARHAVPLHQTPHSSLLRPHSYDLTPHSSLLTPHSSLLTPHDTRLTK